MALSKFKFKKPYQLLLTPYHRDKVLTETPQPLSIVYLKPNQEVVPVGSLVQVCTQERGLNFKKEHVLVYAVTRTDHEKREIYAQLKGITKKNYHSITKNPVGKLIGVIDHIGQRKIRYTILHRNLLRKTERVALKKLVDSFLRKELSGGLYQCIHKIATKQINEDCMKVVGAVNTNIKGLTIENYC